jgi:hypothetical protein
MKRAIPAVIVALALFNTLPANALVNITQHPTDQVVSLNAHVTNFSPGSDHDKPFRLKHLSRIRRVCGALQTDSGGVFLFARKPAPAG